MSRPRRRKFVGPIVWRVTWHGGRGTPYLRRWALIMALAREGEQRVKQRIAAALDGLPVAHLVRSMAAPALGRDEQHAGRGDRREVLGVVPGPGGHALVLELERLAREGDGVHHA